MRLRFQSFLLFCLLAVTLSAQNNCQIFDLSATVNGPNLNSAGCEYFVTLNFQHSGTTNQYVVSGNGATYGTFSYSQVPVTLGPFTAGPTPTSREFVVKDLIFPDCSDFVLVDIPACTSSVDCSISNLTVQTGDCNPGGLSYNLWVNFQVTNPGNDFFEVYAANNTLLGTFPIAALPLHIPVFPWNGAPVDHIKVCINDQPDCCTELEFNAPDCVTAPPCPINDLVVAADGCTSDSTYKVKINFNLPNTGGLIDSFQVYANGQWLGNYGVNQLPLVINNFPTNGGTTDEVKICLIPLQTVVCCVTKEVLVPDCLAPCGIKNLITEVLGCSSDSTFKLNINFSVNDPATVDSFSLWANGQFQGHFGMNQLPLQLDSIHWNGQVFNSIRICTGNSPACCIERTIIAPDCLPFGPCEVTNIFVQTGSCTSDSTYKVKIFFNATNPGNGTFTLWAGNTIVDTFPLTAMPITLNNFPWSGNQADLIRICINSDSMTPGVVLCCREKEFNAPDCIFPPDCNITNLHVETGNCEQNNTYNVWINFNVANPPAGNIFIVYANGNPIGTYNLSQLPLHITNFPWGGGQQDAIKVCMASTSSAPPTCCAAIEFAVPDCLGQDCEIHDLVVDPGTCESDSTYHLVINFAVTNPTSSLFDVYANGNYFGTYNLGQLPLNIPNFPWNGGPNDFVKICMQGNAPTVGSTCCAVKEFAVPDCLQPGDCVISNLHVETGNCESNNTYNIWVNFTVTNPGTNTFGVWANGSTFLGTYNLSQLPLHITNFPWDGGQFDGIKVCMMNSNSGTPPGCCATLEFHVPDCVGNNTCEIYNLVADTGNCTSDSSYSLTINFQVQNAPDSVFGVWANGTYLGSYNLSQLPLNIPNFPWNGGVNDVVKVCFLTPNGAATCCAAKEFAVPGCLFPGDCVISNLHVETGNCESNNTYNVWINFSVSNTNATTFGVWANGSTFLGTFNLNQLPLHFTNFPWDGGQFDGVKVCMINPGSTAPLCCAVLEFHVPDCLNSNTCEIYNLVAEAGDCTGDSTYHLTLNFQANNAPSTTFGVWANNVFFGTYNMSQLPLNIPNFPWNGGPNDVVKVCFVTSTSPTNCCATKEFPVPPCLNQGPCSISNLAVETGDCTGDSTYMVKINFSVNNPPSNVFGVWANNIFLGTFNVNQLPLAIPNFPWNGGTNDFVKVCFGNGGVTSCCAVKEFAVPDCLTPGGPCEIHNLVVETGGCTGDSTYKVTINFSVLNVPIPGTSFVVFANGTLLGTFNLTQLPLSIPNFPWNGGQNDVIKVCIVTTPGAVTCCAVKEFAVPDCLFNNNDCHIYDVKVRKTPCVCGQFFALVSFSAQNGSGAGVDITGNGNNYGNFPYNTAQPVIIGPLNGDGITSYEFVVTDHEFADCHDAFELGKVECNTPVSGPLDGSKLMLSPNPAGQWLNVAVQLNGGAKAGQTQAEIYHADGRLVETVIIGDGSNFQLDVSALPAAMYRLVLMTESGRLEGTFAKQ